MPIKILGGKAKGMTLGLPDRKIVRPTLALLKRRLFDRYQDFTGKIFIDGCAGSGSIGFEAWSRGCDQLYLIETNKKVFFTLQNNAEKIFLAFPQDRKKISCRLMSLKKFLSFFKKKYASLDEEQKKNTILYFDPPYHMESFYREIHHYLQQNNWFKGQFWVESDDKIGIAPSYWQETQGVIQTFAQSHSYLVIVQF
jgi:16S rRNA (guanine966-N2)-methyltransferase